MKTGRLTVRDEILVAAACLDRSRGGGEFTAEDLVVAAWRLYPGSFGMSGYDYPHSQRVVCRLSGPDGLIEKGLLGRVVGALKLTDAGRRKAVQGGVFEPALAAYRAAVATAPRTAPAAPAPRPPAQPSALVAATAAAQSEAPRRRPKPPRAPVQAPAAPPPRLRVVDPPAERPSWTSVPMPQRFVGSPIPRGMPARPLPAHPVPERSPSP